MIGKGGRPYLLTRVEGDMLWVLSFRKDLHLLVGKSLLTLEMEEGITSCSLAQIRVVVVMSYLSREFL